MGERSSSTAVIGSTSERRGRERPEGTGDHCEPSGPSPAAGTRGARPTVRTDDAVISTRSGDRHHPRHLAGRARSPTTGAAASRRPRHRSTPRVVRRSRACVAQPAPDARRPRRTLGALLALVVIALGERLAHRDRVLPGRGGRRGRPRRQDRARGAARDRGPRRRDSRSTPIHAHAGTHDLVLDPKTIGYRVDAAATVRAARRDGRSANPLDTLLGVPLRAAPPRRRRPRGALRPRAGWRR